MRLNKLIWAQLSGSAWENPQVWDLKLEIQEFCQMTGRNIPELTSADWLTDFAFAVDVTALINELKSKLQGRGLFAHELHSLCKAFTRKQLFLSSQVEDNTLTHLPTLKERIPSADQLHTYSLTLKTLHDEFSRRFEDFKAVEPERLTVSSPFTCDVDSAPTDVQLELIDLQSDVPLAQHFKALPLLTFYSSLKEENFPHLRSLA
ncbi:hypothetical protein LDENG_00134850 [Lucifuga dentata]|nr:hypothetical protein LDENG_00134850 [Lucifuga dentata]